MCCGKKLWVCITVSTTVLSCLALAYFIITVCIPYHHRLHSGFIEEPVMCTTVSIETSTNCTNKNDDNFWNSCDGHLSKYAGPEECTQIRVDARKAGSLIKLEGCDPKTFETKFCDGSSPDEQSYECVLGDCARLHGLFHCVSGITTPTGESTGSVCRNYTSILECNVTTTDVPVVCNTRKACLKFDGLYECEKGECGKIRPPFSCKQKCTEINTYQKNVVIRQGDKIHTANCKRALIANIGHEIWPREITDSEKLPTLLMSCTGLDKSADKSILTASDCVNGTILDYNYFGNSTTLTQIENSPYRKAMSFYANKKRFVAPEKDLLIYNNTKLLYGFANHATLNDCKTFQEKWTGGWIFGSPNRFSCFSSKTNNNFVVYNLEKARSLGDVIIGAVACAVILALNITALYVGVKVFSAKHGKNYRYKCSCYAGIVKESNSSEGEQEDDSSENSNDNTAEKR